MQPHGPGFDPLRPVPQTVRRPTAGCPIGLGFRVPSKVAQQGDVSFHKGTSGFRLGPGHGALRIGVRDRFKVRVG